ncbi:MAG TPA: RtcB family protein, partial [Thermodesulfobacteriota bacterium]|nr:RtcB family protein [Thermodesulfobacteriota bacterium]
MEHSRPIKTIKINDYLFEIPKTGRMLVPGRLYVNEKILKSIIEDRSIEQVVNVAHLPGIQKYSIAMPDIHLGYGFPIGGVAATDIETGVISPGGVGYDINCGVRLMRTNLTEKDVRPSLRLLVEQLFKTVPCGPGIGGKIKLSDSDYNDFTDKGVKWAIERGWGIEQDLEMIEDRGYFSGSNLENISQKALERGRNQL